MINTSYNVSTPPTAASGGGKRPEGAPKDPQDGYAWDVGGGVRVPVSMGRPSFPEPAVCPRPMPEPAVCPEPVVGFEDWLTAKPTDNPNVGAKFAAKAQSAFGEQALTSVCEDRIRQAGGYHYDGLETPGGGDFLTSRTLAWLGGDWEAKKDGSYEISGQGVGQNIRFDAITGKTTLETWYDENRFDTTRYSETLTHNTRTGEITIQHNAPGL